MYPDRGRVLTAAGSVAGVGSELGLVTKFDGNNARVGCGPIGRYGSGDFSALVWMWEDSTGGVQKYMIDCGESDGSNGWRLAFNQGSTIDFYINASKASSYNWFYGSQYGMHTNSAWHLFGVSKIGTAAQFYCDGVAINMDLGSTVDATITTTTKDLTVGALFLGGDWYYDFMGMVAELRLYNYGLSASDHMRAWQPQTRWDLHRQLSQRLFFSGAAPTVTFPWGTQPQPFSHLDIISV